MRIANLKKVLAEEKECVICGKKFFRRRKKSKTTHIIGVRKTGSLTCSKECSRKRVVESNKVDRHKKKEKTPKDTSQLQGVKNG